MTDETHCQWIQSIEENYETACGNIFAIEEGTPKENGFKFCCYCGKQLAEQLYVEDES